MTKPENLYKKDLSEYAARANPTLEGSIILQALAQAFEEGVDAGRKWGHEEKDEKWREDIHRALRNHTEQFVYGHERIIPVEHIEALL